MRTNVNHLLLLLALASLPGIALGQGSTIGYQGRLQENGLPATGLYDFTFAVFANEAGGAPLEPALTLNAVPVANGLFNVPLNLGAGIFTGAARWLEINVRPAGIGPFTPMDARVALLPTPYAIFAGSAGTVESGAVTASQLNTGGVNPTPGQFLSYNGGNLTWSDPGVAAGGIWSVLNNNAYYTAGHVGIGTMSPATRLTVHSVGYGIEHTDGTRRLSSYLSATGGWFGTRSSDPLNFFVNDGLSSMTISASGNIGIGTTTPTSKLDIAAQDALRLTGFQPFITFFEPNASNARSRIQSVSGSMNFFTESYMAGSNPSAFIALHNNGNVGIGSAAPIGKLEVVGQDALRLIGYQPFLTLYDADAGYIGSRIQTAGGEMILSPASYLNGSDPNAYVKLFNSGALSVKTLTIRGGADLAEPFELSVTDISKGSVVVIDEDQPGKLKLSTRAYDTRVAGILSGANGIEPGISLYQQGMLEGGQNVALSGRVYVLADASSGAIKPGDLLTTSDTAGHAMKVSDHTRSQGAILGKAMSTLREGKGTVLVLVTLQ